MTEPANDADEAVFPFYDAYIAPLMPMLERPDVTDIYVNRPGEVWIETIAGQSERFDAPDLTEARLWRLARQVASMTHQGISREHPLLAARLPDGSRIQIVAPPATRGPLAIAIRRHVVSDMSLADYAGQGAFSGTRVGKLAPETPSMGGADRELEHLLRDAVRQRRTILISGGTATGKTTFLNALLREIPDQERLIIIEDTPELIIRHRNAVGLVAVKGELGEAQVSTDDLLQASLRMRPDRVILGELRGQEAHAFLRAINTGHPGSISTIHANSPEGAVDQLALLVQASSTLRRTDVVSYVRHIVDVFVQLERINGARRVSAVATRR